MTFVSKTMPHIAERSQLSIVIKLCDITALFGIFYETNMKISRDSATPSQQINPHSLLYCDGHAKCFPPSLSTLLLFCWCFPVFVGFHSYALSQIKCKKQSIIPRFHLKETSALRIWQLIVTPHCHRSYSKFNKTSYSDKEKKSFRNRNKQRVKIADVNIIQGRSA